MPQNYFWWTLLHEIRRNRLDEDNQKTYNRVSDGQHRSTAPFSKGTRSRSDKPGSTYQKLILRHFPKFLSFLKRNTPQLAATGIKGMRIQLRL